MKPKIIFDNYEIFEDGSLYSHKSKKYRKPDKDKLGYSGYCISVNGKQKRYYGHRLVAMAFIENNFNYKEVNHKDCNRSNNNVSNLEWVNRSQNVNYSIKYGNRKIGQVKKIKIHRKSNRIILDLQTGIFYDSTRQAAFVKNMNRSTLIGKLSGNFNNNTTLKYV